SSMVFESSNVFPTPEGAQLTSPPPKSTYGFQKLATEYFAKGAHEQYGLPYTIVRPFNCVGIGERRALRDHEVMSGNVKLAMSHVVPDLCQKVLKDQDPLHILGDGSQVRHYTYGGDLAHGIRLAMESDRAVNEDFNLSTARSLVVPAYNEGENAAATLRGIVEHAHMRPLEVLVVHDFDEDTTVPVVRRLQAEMPELELHRNKLGRGVLNAIKSGLAAAGAPYVLVTMGDASDDPADIDAMYELAKGGADVVAGSRYMR